MSTEAKGGKTRALWSGALCANVERSVVITVFVGLERGVVRGDSVAVFRIIAKQPVDAFIPIRPGFQAGNIRCRRWTPQ